MVALASFQEFYVKGIRGSSPQPQVVVENSTVGSLTSDGRLIYAIDDLQTPPPPEFEREDGWGYPAPFRGVYHSEVRRALSHNRLQAYVVASGKLAWELGGVGRGNELDDSFFLGPPLPLGGKLYVVNQKDRQLRLLRLDPYRFVADDGEFERASVGAVTVLKTPLARIEADPLRRIQACRLAGGEGVLVCPSNDGELFGVDLLTGGVRWVYRYRWPADEPAEWEAGRGYFKPMPDGWIRLPDGTARPLLISSFHHGKPTPPAIADGKVVFAPADSRALVCLDLQTGARVWSQTRTNDELYLAGVFDGVALMVGKTGCRGLDLATGKVRWTTPTGPPSGFGAAAGGVYYLPIGDAASKLAEVCALDLRSGRVLGRVVDKRDAAPGNLLFVEGGLASQSATELVLYPRLTDRLSELNAAIARKPDDLALRLERGEVRRSNGKYQQAIDDLHRVLEGKPERATLMRARTGLLDAVAALLEQDYAAGEKYLADYEKAAALGVDPEAPAQERWAQSVEVRVRRAEVLLLRAAGGKQLGRATEALTAYIELADLDDAAAPLKPRGEAGLALPASVWARGRIERLLAQATPEQRKLLDAAMEKRYDAANDARDEAALRRVAALFAGAAAGRRAALKLAERLIADKHYLEAEMWLLQVRRSADAAQAARALLLLARASAARGLLEDAAGFYRALGRDYAAVEVAVDQTGKDVLEEIKKDKRYLPYLEERRAAPWPKFQPGKEERGVFPPPERQTLRVEADGPSFLAGRRLELTAGRDKLLLLDRTGVEVWALDLPESVHQPTRDRFGLGRDRVPPVPPPPAHALGRLLQISLWPQLLAVEAGRGELLWQRLLLHESGFRLAGGVVCVRIQTGVAALDPLTGRILWQRTGLDDRCRLEADEHHVYVIESVGETPTATHAFRLLDGAAAPIKDFTERYRQKLRFADGRLLWSAVGDDGVTLGVYEPAAGKDVWKKTYPPGSIVLRSHDAALTGAAERNGKVNLLRVADGTVEGVLTVDLGVLQTGPDPTPVPMPVLRELHLLSDAQRFYLAAVGPPDASLLAPVEANVEPGLGLPTLPVNGWLCAYKRESKELSWARDIRNQVLLRERFEEMPVVFLSCRRQQRGRFTPGSKDLTVYEVFDKQTGKILFQREAEKAGRVHALSFDPVKGRVEAVAADRRIVFQAKP
jgi:outer membrane protein assembly factor BamB